MKQGKRYIQAQKLVDASKAYEPQDAMKEIGRASCRERVCQYV